MGLVKKHGQTERVTSNTLFSYYFVGHENLSA